MSRFAFCGPSYQSTSPIVNAEECINFYPESTEGSQAKTALALYPTPGLAVFASLPSGDIPQGIIWVPSQGRCFAAGNKLYELLADGTVVDLGVLLPPIGPVFMACNPTQLLICTAGTLWTLTFSTNTLTKVGSPPFTVVSQIGFSDGFFVAMQTSPAAIALSAINNGASWPALSVSTISLFPDNLVSMIVDHREIVLFGNTKSVVYANAGAAIFPFQPVPGSYVEQGADSLAAQVQLDNSVFWTSFDQRGNLVAYRSQGYNGIRISNHAVEQQWQSYPKTSDAIGYSFQMNGHPWWHIYFPTAKVSWRYDVSTGMWHKALGWDNGQWTAHNSQAHAFAFGKHLVADWNSSNIYQMAMPSYSGGSWNFCDDAGAPIRRLRRCPYIQTEWVRMFHNRIQFDLEVGLGPIPPLTDGSGNPRDPQMILRWSDDGTKTWSNDHFLNCGQAGNYNRRVFKTRLGSTLHGRVYEVNMTDPIPWRFADAYLDAEPGMKPVRRLSDQLKAGA